MEVVSFLQQEPANISIALNPRKTVTVLSKGRIPMLEEIALLEGVDGRIAERVGVKVVGVPIGTDEYVMDSAMEIVKNGGADQFARMLPRMPDKQSANLIATGSMVQQTAYVH